MEDFWTAGEWISPDRETTAGHRRRHRRAAMLELAQALSRVLLVEEVKAGRADGSGDSRQEGRDVRVTAVLGYRDGQLFLKEEFEPWAEVYVSTDDGSAGTKGTVIDAVRENGVEADVFSGLRAKAHAAGG